jgi:hypothetical protein
VEQVSDTTAGVPIRAYDRVYGHGDFVRDGEGRIWHLVNETDGESGRHFTFWVGTHFDAEGSQPDQATLHELPEPVTPMRLIEWYDPQTPIPIAWLSADFQRAAENVVGAAGRMLDQWAERSDDPTRNRDLWTPLHRAADELGELLDSADRCPHGYPPGAICRSGFCGDGSGTGVVVHNDLMREVLRKRGVERLAAELWGFIVEGTLDADKTRRQAADLLTRFTPFIDRTANRAIAEEIVAAATLPTPPPVPEEVVEALAATLWNFSVGECRYGTPRWENWAPQAPEDDADVEYTRGVAWETLTTLGLDQPVRHATGSELATLTASHPSGRVRYADVGHTEEGMIIAMGSGTPTATPLPPDPPLPPSHLEVIRPTEPENTP